MTAKVSVKERGVPALQRHCWPPVPAFEAMNEDFKRFIGLGYEEQNTYLNGLRDDALYVQTLNEFLGVVSAYLFSYHDSPLHLSTDDDFEIALQRGKDPPREGGDRPLVACRGTGDGARGRGSSA